MDLGSNLRDNKTRQEKKRSQPRARTRVFQVDGDPHVPHIWGEEGQEETWGRREEGDTPRPQLSRPRARENLQDPGKGFGEDQNRID